MAQNMMLSEVLDNYDPCDSIKMTNFVGQPIGTHHVGIYKEVLDKLELDFVVSKIEESGRDDEGNEITPITVDIIDEDILDKFIYMSNVKEMEYDKYYGSGKYWRDTSY